MIRERAIIVLGRFSRLDFEEENHIEVAKQILEKIEDEDLPVRIASACNLYLYIRKPEVKNALSEQLSFILEKYLLMMDEIDHEELVSAFEELVGEFSDNIGPYAV